MSTPINISTQSVPSAFCFTTWQEAWPLLVGLINANIDQIGQFINYGRPRPSAENQNKPWFKLNDDESPDRIYWWFGGNWVAEYPIKVGDQRVWMWKGTQASITTLDGGDGNPISDTTGAFWAEDTDFAYRFPVGVGTFPISGVAVLVGGTGGEDKHLLTTDEIPAHTHDFSVGYGTQGAVGGLDPTPKNDLGYQAFVSQPNVTLGLAHENLPPYRGVYFIKRTARKYWLG